MKITINEQIRSAKEWQFYITDLSKSRQNLKFMESQARDKKSKMRNYCKKIHTKENSCAFEKRVTQEERNNTMTYEEWEKQTEELDRNDLIELIKKVRSFNLALFSSLYQVLEERGSDNVSSQIDFLTGKNNAYTSDLYKSNKRCERLEGKIIQLEQEQNRRAIEALIYLKTALENQINPATLGYNDYLTNIRKLIDELIKAYEKR